MRTLSHKHTFSTKPSVHKTNSSSQKKQSAITFQTALSYYSNNINSIVKISQTINVNIGLYQIHKISKLFYLVSVKPIKALDFNAIGVLSIY